MSGCSKCQICRNFNSKKSVSFPEKKWYCEAFPEGIPELKLAFISRDSCENCNNGIGFDQMTIEEQMNLR